MSKASLSSGAKNPIDASVYGMNIKIPMIGGIADFCMILGLMITTILVVIFVFRKRRML